jgi:hypothetical protein
VSKFVGKFRKNKDYNDDYQFKPPRKHRNEHGEIKKLKNRNYEDVMDMIEELKREEQVYQK